MLKTIWKNSWLAVIPMLAGLFIFSHLAPHAHWEYTLLHTLIEGGGALVLLCLNLVIITLIYNGMLPKHYSWIIACFATMGILDLFHSLTSPGQAFVWLHSLATFFGGLLAAMLWSPPAWAEKIHSLAYFLGLSLLMMLIAIFSIVFPEWTAPMLTPQGDFTAMAKWLNILGGIGFLVAWTYFIREYIFRQQNGTGYYSNHFLLLGLAGILFEVSALWDGNWWLWHILRIVAYKLLLVHFALQYWLQLKELREVNQHLNTTSSMLNDALQKVTKQTTGLEEIIKERTLELEVARDEAVTANRAKSSFLSVISHELRTPMHAILSFSHLGLKNAEKKNLAQKNHHYYARIHQSGERLMMLINDLLDLSKLEARKMEMNFQHNNLNTLVQGSAAENEARLVQQGIAIKTQFTADSSEGIFDAQRIFQVITNLVSNAIKFAPANTRITISTQSVTRDINAYKAVECLHFSIHDQGKGIPATALESIFDTFSQSPHNGEITEGTGLGLAICKEIIDLHHGRIWAENHPDGGALFQFYIPRDPCLLG